MGARNRVMGSDQVVCPPCWQAMFRILYRLLALLARLAVRSGRSKDLEIIVLRHQLTVLRRQVDRPAINDDDRTLLGAIAAALRVDFAEAGSSRQRRCCVGTANGSPAIGHSLRNVPADPPPTPRWCR